MNWYAPVKDALTWFSRKSTASTEKRIEHELLEHKGWVPAVVAKLGVSHEAVVEHRRRMKDDGLLAVKYALRNRQSWMLTADGRDRLEAIRADRGVPPRRRMREPWAGFMKRGTHPVTDEMYHKWVEEFGPIYEEDES